ncbi:lytic polysaccharide monooxygenase auxiliary activity family 9 protein [Streptomyces spectabilis]|uniref:Chitin-binding protein n=1 Tax=Streptomyces spectabilis TaxID=68270 RepID=A0A5P2X204_STRST|nr:lytic polysaccharide monooxygenase [Streptomyces spectabilis]MBB5106073.1 chitin-binding protein [Streptomyces spectabilis]MCI3901603.1 lytic polysaccharide monooxygenase [Streptomyces spectabilis]QEV59053.1 LPXTG cell wall anchor domain-containing protein [Streptomyces spectabilis]GGV25831.1 chitin-binding protein [Streptomyces spectabilis]
MHARRKVAALAAAGAAPLVLSLAQAQPAAAHGSMTDPVSRVAACFQEGPEAPKSAACKALVRAGGTQPLYDWNEVNIANAAGRSKEIIPDGKLCSAGNAKYKGLDLPRSDWPASKLSAGKHTFRYRATAPHRGSFELYLTKASYDPAKPLKWSDLQARPFAKVTDPKLVNGSYEFSGTVPARSGRHLVYSIWQRSDSPEAFYTCSDVVFGRGKAKGAAAPSEKDIRDGAEKSTVEHHGHGDLGGGEGNAPEAKGGAAKPVAATSENLAETGGDGSSAYYAVGGAAALALGSGTLFVAARRRAATNR